MRHINKHLLPISLYPLPLFLSAQSTLPAYSLDYDPVRDPFADGRAALKLAQDTNRRVLIEVGGDWCRWCHVLNKFLEEEDKRSAPLQVIGMLNRQMRLLWQAKTIAAKGGNSKDIARNLGLAPFSAGNFLKQSRHWSEEELEKSFSLLYKADHLLKSGSRPKPVMENLVMLLCG